MTVVLSGFLGANREALLSRARQLVSTREAPRATEIELTLGLPLFFDQLRDALERAAVRGTSDHSELGKTAERHGSDLFKRGLTIGQVVHDYGALCQAVTGLAVERKAAISSEDFQTLNLCLDDAIAAAVTEYAHRSERAVADAGKERLGELAHELRNLLNNSLMAVASMKKGLVGLGGSTAALLDRSLLGMHVLLDRSFADVRLDSNAQNMEPLPVAEVIGEVEIGASMLAEKRDINFTIGPLDYGVIVEADRQILAASITNLLQNAFKFTHHGSTVGLTMKTTNTRVLVEVEDECGGLPRGQREILLQPFAQGAQNRSGLGLGLSICSKAMKAMSGELHIRDLPGKGCVFSLDLPRH